ncbi:Peregrin, partial [Gryllus bimaculatus]
AAAAASPGGDAAATAGHVKASATASPATPAKAGVSAEQQAQLTVSPSGVNRRTAVLFTRKAQAAAAFRRPDQPGATPPSTPAATPATNKRRVGRPRKNLDAALSARPEPTGGGSGAGAGPGPGGGGGGKGGAAEDKAAGVLGAPSLPFSESFRVYRQGGEIPQETDEETQSDSSCSSCSSTEGSTGSSGGASSSIDLQHPSAGESSAEDEASTATPRAGTTTTGGPSAASGTTTTTTAAATATTMSLSDTSVLEPLDLVWAKCRGYPWYPALIIDPKMPRSGYVHKGVPIPAPPVDVLALASNYDEPVYLVLFFDTKRTWQWLPRIKLEPLGISSEVDQSKLTESRKPTERKAVRKAYEEAMQHRCQVAGGVRRGRAASTGAAAAATSGEDA